MAKTINFPRGHIGQTQETFREAFQNGRTLAESLSSDMGCMNISDELTVLIQYAGRFVESYASDLLIHLNHPCEVAASVYPLEEPIDEIYVFGLRRSGIDGGHVVLSSLYDNNVTPYHPWLLPESRYRKVLAWHMTVSPGEYSGASPRVTSCVKDITDALTKTSPNDIDENGKLKN